MKYTTATILLLSAIIGFLSCVNDEGELPQIRDKADFIAYNDGLSDKEILGKKIFFDSTLSEPAGMSCSSCHDPITGFSDPKHAVFSAGALPGEIGARNAPTIAYLTLNPTRYYNAEDETYVGGFFYDGRRNSLEDQAQEPFLSKREMNNSSRTSIIAKIKAGSYAGIVRQLYGEDIYEDTSQAFSAILDAIAAFEKTYQVSPFSSKYDYYLKGKVQLTEQEFRGLLLFNDPQKGNCNACHPSSADNSFGAALFTDFTYDNTGAPRNKLSTGIDLGLGSITGSVAENGKFKVPTLRNVAITAPYFHNGVFTTLEEAIEFYNSRDIKGKFDDPEVQENMNKEELGNLNLSAQEVLDISAFLNTLTDGYQIH